jgi:predicted house-cleaning noncanonical NTP pyrophosphatase (MazG superfamily)
MSPADDKVHVMRVTYDKLVRDHIPEIIRAAGHHPVTRVLDHPAYQVALLDKLVEEAHEARQTPTGHLAAELADVLEVLQAIAAAHDLPWDHIVATATGKRTERGAFTARLFLEYVEETE